MIRRLHIFCVLFFTVAIATPFSLAEEKKDPKTVSTETVTTSQTRTEYLRRQDTIHPTVYGSAGIFRVRSAEGLPPGTFTFGIGGEYYSVSSVPLASGSVSAKTISESLFVGFSPARNLTISIMRRGSSTTFGNPQQLVSSLGDFNFAGLYSIPLGEHLKLGPMVNVQVASNFNNLSPSGDTASVGVGTALTYDMTWLAGLPLFLHANLIYHMPQIRDAGPVGVTTQNFFNFSRFHTITFGLGAELKLGNFIPFVELYQTNHLNSGVNLGNAPSSLSLGVRMTPFSNKSLAFLVGGDIGIGKGIVAGVPYTPGGQVIGMVSYTVALSQTERHHYYTTDDVNIVDRKFDIDKNIEFELNSDKLTANGEALVDEIADVIKKNGVQRLLIVGHTDSTHTHEYNLRLSKRRAESVKRRLVSQGIEEDVMTTDGRGKTKPIATNLTEAGRAKNRRVEFFILK